MMERTRTKKDRCNNIKRERPPVVRMRTVQCRKTSTITIKRLELKYKTRLAFSFYGQTRFFRVPKANCFRNVCLNHQETFSPSVVRSRHIYYEYYNNITHAHTTTVGRRKRA